MSNYIPLAGAAKKRMIRDKRIDELKGAIKRQESAERLERAAEKSARRKCRFCFPWSEADIVPGM